MFNRLTVIKIFSHAMVYRRDTHLTYCSRKCSIAMNRFSNCFNLLLKFFRFYFVRSYCFIRTEICEKNEAEKQVQQNLQGSKD